jgi:hypothetical protein
MTFFFSPSTPLLFFSPYQLPFGGVQGSGIFGIFDNRFMSLIDAVKHDLELTLAYQVQTFNSAALPAQDIRHIGNRFISLFDAIEHIFELTQAQPSCSNVQVGRFLPAQDIRSCLATASCKCSMPSNIPTTALQRNRHV